MCCSAWPVEFSHTITGTWEVMVDGRLRHVLWYQNRVGKGSAMGAQVFEVIVRKVLAGEPLQLYKDQMQVNNINERDVQDEVNNRLRQAGRLSEVKELPATMLPLGRGNCLIIPLPGSWGSIRLLNTLTAPSLLFDIEESLRLPARDAVWGSGVGSWGGLAELIFLRFDIYDIVIAQNALDIPAVLPQIVPEKRPEVNDSVFRVLHEWYQCPVAVCCFNDAQSGESKPLAISFEPAYPDKIVVYTLDGHDGKPPDPNALVSVDHTIFVGSYRTDSRYCGKVTYSDSISPDLRPYVLDHVMGLTILDRMENGDLVFETDSVRAGHFEGFRMLPPKAPAGVPKIGQSITRNEAYERDR